MNKNDKQVIQIPAKFRLKKRRNYQSDTGKGKK